MKKAARIEVAEKTAEEKATDSSTEKIVVKDWSIFLRFFKYSLKYKKILIFSILSIPILTLASVVSPWIIVQIGDQILVHKQFTTMKFWVGILVVSIFVNIVFEFCYTYSMQYVAQRTMLDSRQDLFERILSFPKLFFDKEPLGKVLSRLTSDFENVQESLAIGLLTFLIDLIKTTFLLIILFFLSYQLAIIVVLFIPIILIVTQIIRKILREVYITARKSLAQGAAYLSESIQGIQTVQLYLVEEKTHKNYAQKNYLFFKKQCRSNLYESFLFSFVEAISIICVLVILWYSSVLSLQSLISISVIIAFINALQKCFVPIRELFQQVSTIQRALASLHQIEIMFQSKIEVEPKISSQNQIKFFNNISFKNVSFRYPGHENYVLKNISFELAQKQKIALVGATGSGKSTVLRIISKQYQNYEGSIKINGVELKEIPRTIFNNICSVQFQDVFLFNETIAFNIALDNPAIDRQKIIEALKYVDIWDFVTKLEQGLDFYINDNGKNLSSGQRQLLSLARVVVQQKELFLLDEVTSSVDSVTTKKINNAIEKIFKQKTVIAIAHQLNTIQQSDFILYLKNGKIIERGSHEQLLKQQGEYAVLISKKN